MVKYLLIMSLIFFINCAKTEYYIKDVNNKVRLTSFSPVEGYSLKRRFQITHMRVNLFWGLYEIEKKDLDSILRREFRNPETEAVGNLSITETYDFLDSLVDFILIGLVRPYSVVIRGEIYEKKAAPSKTPEDTKESKLPISTEKEPTKN
ncbi:MAG: hypothetical protein H7A23_24245 [Leptospiraceae bacterium]|nr:hypothetical protein [Leptospiraceae bacterium]MCP5497676.1 hypothetical protein [Leptospiraceae bacterium]